MKQNMVVLGEVPVDVDDPLYLTWKAIDRMANVIELLGWYVLEEDDQSEWREQAVKWYHEKKNSTVNAIDKLREAIVAKAVEGQEMTSKNTMQQELDTTQRELNAAIYYTWEAIRRIEYALLDLKWMIDTSTDSKEYERTTKAFLRSFNGIADIRTKFNQERLRIAMEGKDDD